MPAQLLGDVSLNGYPGAASGSLRFYQPGTLIPVVVYSNDAATSAITQPVPLDANGRSTTPVYVTKMVRMIVYDSNGAQLQDIERADGLRAETTSLVNTSWPLAATEDAAWTLLGTSLGTTNGNFKASGTGSVARSVQSKLSEQFSVKDFGAKGDGITDDFAAITATFAAAGIAGGGIVFFPAGTYLISQTIALTNAQNSNTQIQGSGPAASVIKNSSGTGNAISMSSGTNISFSGIGIAASTTSTGMAITMTGATQTSILFTNCAISGHRTGISQTSSSLLGMTLIATTITTDNNAAAVAMAFADQSYNIFLYGCSLTGGTPLSTGTCVTMGANGAITMFGTTMSGQVGLTTAGSDFAIYGGARSVVVLSTLYTVTGGTPIISVISPSLATAIPSNAQKSIFISSSIGGSYGDAGPYLTSNVASTSFYNVALTTYKNHRIVGTVAGITITVTAPPANNTYQGAIHTVICANNSGGAVTWAFSAAYRAGATAPATGNQVGISFLCIDAVTPVFVEINRGSTVAI